MIASGLTGGVLYIAPDPLLAQKVHRDGRIAPMTADDVTCLAAILDAHRAATGSHRAESLLTSGAQALAAFVKILPA